MLRGMLLGALLYHLGRAALDRHQETARLFDEVSRAYTEELQRLQGKPLRPLMLSEWLDRQPRAEPER